MVSKCLRRCFEQVLSVGVVEELMVECHSDVRPVFHVEVSAIGLTLLVVEVEVLPTGVIVYQGRTYLSTKPILYLDVTRLAWVGLNLALHLANLVDL